MDVFAYQNGLLHAEGVALPAIAEAVGTPVYVYSAERIRHNFRTLAGALLDIELCFAVKANSNLAILKILADEGAGADIVSGGELARALKAGIPANKIVFSGVGKTDEEITAALKAGIHQINVESLPEIRQISRLATFLNTKAAIAFRVNPDVAADTHHKIATGRKGDKFGIDHEQLSEAATLAKSLPSIELVGLACHIGSQLFDVEAYRAAYTVLAQYVAQLREQGHSITRLDLGGGMGVPYKGETPFYAASYARVVQETVGKLGCSLCIEPGRYIVADAGALLCTVTHFKQGVETSFLVIDGAMNDLIRPALYESWHGVRPVVQGKGFVQTVDIVGPICESGDTFATARSLPPMAAGDLLVLDTAGAYGAVMSSFYNTRALVPEVLVEGRRFAVIRERISAEVQMGWDKIPEWL